MSIYRSTFEVKGGNSILCKTLSYAEEQKKVIQKEMDRLEHLGIIQKGLTGYSSLVRDCI